MAPTKVPSRPAFRNPSPKDPERHRRAYEEAGELWPTDVGKHLARAAALEDADRQRINALRRALRRTPAGDPLRLAY